MEKNRMQRRREHKKKVSEKYEKANNRVCTNTYPICMERQGNSISRENMRKSSLETEWK
jgi:hypothetical protein